MVIRKLLPFVIALVGGAGVAVAESAPEQLPVEPASGARTESAPIAAPDEQLVETPDERKIEFVIGENPSNLPGVSNVSVRIGSKTLTPGEVELTPGTTVVWVNRSKQPVQVRFTGGAVSTTCKAPIRFEIGAKGVYRSEVLNGGDVASLCFLESQEYPYEIILGETPPEPRSEPTDVASQTSPEDSARELRGLIKVR